MSFFITKTAGALRITRIGAGRVKLSLFVSLLLAIILFTLAPQVNAAVSIKSASPAAVVLTLNKRVIVRLTGTNLSKVKRASVMQGKRSLGSAVSTRLKCVGSGCTLELTLKKNVAAGAYTVQLLGSSRQPAVNVPLKVVVRSAAKALPSAESPTVSTLSSTKLKPATITPPPAPGREQAALLAEILFAPMVITVQPMGMVGSREEGVVFGLISINAQPMGMIGSRVEDIAFSPIVINAQSMGMVGTR